MVNSHGHFVWYELMTTDVEAAKAFYAEVVDWGVRDASAPGMTYAMFMTGGTPVGGLMNLPQDGRDLGIKPRWIGYVCVDAVDAAARTIKSLGGTVHIPPREIPGLSRFSIFADPEAAPLGMLTPLSPGLSRPLEPDAPGRVGWHELHAADCAQAMAFYGTLFGWQTANPDENDLGTYQTFSAGRQTIGGVLTTPPGMQPFWLYYFNVDDVETGAKRVAAGGGEVLDGLHELSVGTWVIPCKDPQGALFALEGNRRRKPVGYFERSGKGKASDPRGRRWSW